MLGKLTARKVSTAKPGKYSDGGNLYLIVSQSGSRKWVLRFTWRGSAKEMGLGSAITDVLAEASIMTPQLRLAFPDRFVGTYGSQDSVLQSVGLQPPEIAKSVLAKLEMRAGRLAHQA